MFVRELLVQEGRVLQCPAPNAADNHRIHEKENGEDSEWNDSVAGWVFDREDDHYSNGERQELYGCHCLFKCRLVLHGAASLVLQAVLC